MQIFLNELIEEPPKSSNLFVPWLYASVFSLLTIGALLAVDRILPGLLDSLLGLNDSNYHGIFPFGMSNPFSGIRRVFLMIAVMVYVGSGLVFYIVREKEEENVKMNLAGEWLFIALGSLFLIVPILGVLWALAWKFGALKLALGGQSSYGNRGPWRHFYDLRAMVQIMLLVPICSSVVAVAGIAFKRIKHVVALVLANLLILYLLSSTHSWLID